MKILELAFCLEKLTYAGLDVVDVQGKGCDRAREYGDAALRRQMTGGICRDTQAFLGCLGVKPRCGPLETIGVSCHNVVAMTKRIVEYNCGALRITEPDEDTAVLHGQLARTLYQESQSFKFLLKKLAGSLRALSQEAVTYLEKGRSIVD